jgi:predicted HicB family RNase H-like nuclease
MSYRGYQGSVEASIEDGCLFGKIQFINDLVTYEANTLKELNSAFQEAVDDYLQMCSKLRVEPDAPFKGTFNVRVTPDIHKRAARRAAEMGVSLNEFVKDAIHARLEEKPIQEIHYHSHALPAAPQTEEMIVSIESPISSQKGAVTWPSSPRI